MKLKLASKIQEGIVKALCYSDIFDYPLKKAEVVKFFVGHAVSRKDITTEIRKMTALRKIGYREGYYFLVGKEKLIKIRRGRQKESIRKIMSSHKTIRLLSYIPTVKMIGLSGSLSMNNAKREDDIDLFIISASNTLWFTRLLVVTILVILNRKRKKFSKLGPDMFCPNMFLTTSSLKINKKDQNIFMAHEVAQVIPVFNKDETYEKFISENSWVLNYLPYSVRKIKTANPSSEKFSWFYLFERLIFLFQYYYMRKRITSERVSINAARFHPKDKTEFVIELYNAKYKSYLIFMKSFVRNYTENKEGLALGDTPGY